jgi:spore maturation protein SpmB
MPGAVTDVLGGVEQQSQTLKEMLSEWAVSTLEVVIKMTTLIYTLAIMQKLLSEYGVIRWILKFLNPFLAIFGLPARTSFLWIVANTLGLAYGAAVMMEEVEAKKVTKKDIDLLNSHIAISHSNLEDLFLLSALGGIWYILLLSRWIGAFVLVWELRLEYFIKERYIQKK